MFEACAKGKPWGRPRFKPAKYKSFTLLQAGWELRNSNKIRTVASVSTDTSSPVMCVATQSVARLNGDAIGDVYICILTDYVEPDPNRSRHSNQVFHRKR